MEERCNGGRPTAGEFLGTADASECDIHYHLSTDLEGGPTAPWFPKHPGSICRQGDFVTATGYGRMLVDNA